MAYTTIDKPDDYFNTVLWTGNGSTQSITGVGFQPDWVWGKERNGATHHQVYDSVRGATKRIYTSSTVVEDTISTGLTSFDSDGFSLGSNAALNNNTNTYVGWNWLAGGTASSNTDGSITSSVSANTTAGFSIVSYTGTGSQATVGHGLGTAPSVLIHKKRTTSAEAWSVFHQSVGITKRMILSSTEAATADASPQPDWNDVLPTSSVFTIGTSPRTNATEDYICYAFAEKKGYSKFGSYTGNGNADGTFVYTGFKPAFLLMKQTNTARNWSLYDNTRNPFNGADLQLMPNSSNAESSDGDIDFVSNGFKFRTLEAKKNQSGGTYIYMAFAENPFVTSTGVPTCAR